MTDRQREKDREVCKQTKSASTACSAALDLARLRSAATGAQEPISDAATVWFDKHIR